MRVRQRGILSVGFLPIVASRLGALRGFRSARIPHSIFGRPRQAPHPSFLCRRIVRMSSFSASNFLSGPISSVVPAFRIDAERVSLAAVLLLPTRQLSPFRSSVALLVLIALPLACIRSWDPWRSECTGDKSPLISFPTDRRFRLNPLFRHESSARLSHVYVIRRVGNKMYIVKQ